MYRVSHAVTLFGLCLLGGTLLALVWANLAPQTYQDMVEWRLIDGFPIGYPNPDALGFGGRTLTLHYLVNNCLMAVFFLLAGKELWEAIVQPGGALRGRAAIVPVGATLGSMIVPAALYLAIAATLRGADWAELRSGWIVPMASDVLLAYLVGRTVFGRAHPALRLLMLIAVASDIAGFLLLGALAPPGPMRPAWLLVPAIAALVAWLALNRLPARAAPGGHFALRLLALQQRFGLLPWFVLALLCWYGVERSGLHPALGLLPVLPAIPHATRSFGLFAEAEEYLSDPLNRLAQALTLPCALGLFLFGLTNGGAVLAAGDSGSSVSFFAFVLGKPAGVLLGAMIAARVWGVGLPAGVTRAMLPLIGLIGACGYTVPLLAAQATLPGGAATEAAKLGLVGALLAAPLALIWARALGIVRQQGAQK